MGVEALGQRKAEAPAGRIANIKETGKSAAQRYQRVEPVIRDQHLRKVEQDRDDHQEPDLHSQNEHEENFLIAEVPVDRYQQPEDGGSLACYRGPPG